MLSDVQADFCLVKTSVEGLITIKHALDYCAGDGIDDWSAFTKLRQRFMEFAPSPKNNPKGVIEFAVTYQSVRMILLALIGSGSAVNKAELHHQLKKGFWLLDQKINEEKHGSYLECYLPATKEPKAQWTIPKSSQPITEMAT